MNILLLSTGTRNKIVEYFKKNIDGKVIATDMSNLAPSIYEADSYYIVPKMTDPNYIEIILNICKTENIKAVLSLIDPELSLLAQNQKVFEDIGVKVIGSSYELCELTLDKYEMYKWLEKHNYKCAKSYVNIEEFYEDVEKKIIDFPVFIKPTRGSASLAICKVEDKITIENVFNREPGLMIQQYLMGQEIGADVYIDLLSGEVVSIFTKKKLKMRAGETDKAISFKDEKLFKLIKHFVEEAGFRGQIDIDIFDCGGEYFISEVNPRFGGGYPHAYESGCNHIKLIKDNLNGIINKPVIGCYQENIVMMKYNEVKIINAVKDNEKTL